jgi:hypothetical protein
MYHYQMYHAATVEHFSPNRHESHDLRALPKEGDENIPCWFSKTDWQHVRFDPIPFLKVVTLENFLLLFGVLSCAIGLIYSIRSTDGKIVKTD